MKKKFCVNVNKYVKECDFEVYYPSSLELPKNHAVTFLTSGHYEQYRVFEKCTQCLIFWPEGKKIPQEIQKMGHAIVVCENPHLRFCEFFEENSIDNVPQKEDVQLVNGAYIATGAQIGNNVVIQPGVYISGETKIGDNCYIGCGVKIMGEVTIGQNVIIRENTVIGADGLTTDRNKSGKPVRMPQFGGVEIRNNVSIGANTVIARGAIDNTFIDEETSIDNCVFVSHNAQIGKRVFIVGETILFGSTRIEDNAFISGNATIRNGIRIGEKAIVGMGAVVVRDVEANAIVKGNPAK